MATPIPKPAEYLASARLKLDRAKEHIDALEFHTRRYMEAQPAPISWVTNREPDVHGGWWNVSRWRLRREPPPELGLIAGDALHNTRTALDHIMAGLSRLNRWQGAQCPNFPLLPRAPVTKRDRDNWQKALHPLCPTHRTAVTNLQPHRDPGLPRSLALLTLASLDNLDKHELVAPVLFNHAGPAGPMQLTDPGMEVFFTPGPVKEGAEFARFRGPSPEVNVEGFVGLGISFGLPDVHIEKLREIRSVVVEVVESFASDF